MTVPLSSPPASAPRSRGCGPPPPGPLPGELPRPDLVRRLADPGGPRVVVVSAPAGYGKTALLAQWARSADVPVTWIDAGAARRRSGDAVTDLTTADAVPGPSLIVVDDADRADPRIAAAIRALVDDPPPGVRVAVAFRSDPGIPLARRLLDGGVLRITARHLRFDAAEVHALLEGCGIAVDAAAAAHLLRRTEGWPAGLRLAALRAATAPDPSSAARAFAGDDRLVAAYLRETVLAGLAPETLEFLTATSVLDRLTGPVCDAVLGTSGSGAQLCAIERENVLLVPLDASGAAFRHHRLLRDMLRADLLRREPGTAARLHRRAAAWHEAADDHPRAVRHALACGDGEWAARLVWDALPVHITRGRARALQRMLDALGVDRVAESAHLSTVAGWVCAETRGDLAAHHLASAERAPARAGATPETAVAAATVTLRALLAPDPAAMARDAAEGFRVAGDDGPWRAYCRFLEGVAHHLEGRVDMAFAPLEDGIDRAGRLAPAVHALCLSQLALLLADHGEPVRALLLARRARAVVEEWGLRTQASAALTFAAGGLANVRSGRLAEARDDLRDLRAVLSETGDAAPWLAVRVRVSAARIGIAVGDDGAARDALAESEAFLGRLREVPLLREEVEELRRRVQPVPEPDGTCLSISTAEARVLALLPTHLSFREIGDRLFLSRFTVKSHAHALYRKLGVSSRSEAVERARGLGMLPRE